ncbi:MAG: Coenzyme F420 hydrogenase/dehydrogenase, beta subunit C-terminal domain [Armatimonadota bacterium]
MEIDKKEQCTGCGGCYNACPTLAIEMSADVEGFAYPVTNEALCNDCGLCRRVCASMNPLDPVGNFNPPIVYAAWSLDEDTRINSTSGGIFSELAHSILQNDGYVVAARYNESHTVEHSVIASVDDLSKLRQSKYLQSDIGVTFRKVRQLLHSGRPVLFCGTSCHVAALRKYLRKDYENLLLCDFVCRGVISPKVFLKYLESLQHRYRGRVEQVTFKNKSYGWNRFSTRITFTNGKQYIRDRYNDSYMIGYLHYNYTLRPSCYHCKYKSLPSISDITLADFWGIKTTRPHLDEDKGTSLVMINSAKGYELFKNIHKHISCEECTLQEAENGNRCIHDSAPINPMRADFFYDLDIMPYDKLIKKYYHDHGKIALLKRIAAKIYRAIKSRLFSLSR